MNRITSGASKSSLPTTGAACASTRRPPLPYLRRANERGSPGNGFRTFGGYDITVRVGMHSWDVRGAHGEVSDRMIRWRSNTVSATSDGRRPPSRPVAVPAPRRVGSGRVGSGRVDDPGEAALSCLRTSASCMIRW
jgi:hypothetical protein